MCCMWGLRSVCEKKYYIRFVNRVLQYCCDKMTASKIHTFVYNFRTWYWFRDIAFVFCRRINTTVTCLLAWFQTGLPTFAVAFDYLSHAVIFRSYPYHLSFSYFLIFSSQGRTQFLINTRTKAIAKIHSLSHLRTHDYAPVFTLFTKYPCSASCFSPVTSSTYEAERKKPFISCPH